MSLRRSVILGFSLAAAVLLAAGYALAVAPLGSWNATYEGEPADTNQISEGALEIRELKKSISARAEVQHCWGPNSCLGADNGIHTQGAAVTLVNADCPTVVPDAAQEDGLLCVDTAGTDIGLWVWISPSWVRADGVPTGTIVIFKDASACPAGYSEYNGFDNLTLRGRDSTNVNGDIPNLALEQCTTDGSGNPGATHCGTALAGKFDDTITTNQMPRHRHEVISNPGGASGLDTQTGTWNGIYTSYTGGVGGVDQPHYHPFQTVLFCEKL